MTGCTQKIPNTKTSRSLPLNVAAFFEISGARIGTEEAFYLYSSGPDLTSIMPCKYGKPSGTFSKFVTEEALRCEHVRELLMKNKDVDTTTLVVS